MPNARQGSVLLLRFAEIDVFLHWSWFLVAMFEGNPKEGNLGTDGTFPVLICDEKPGNVPSVPALFRLSPHYSSPHYSPSFYGYDGHGNVRFLTNAAVTVTDTYQYDAFGMPIAGNGTTANNFRYGGEWFDSGIGLYHLRARYYNQATGRFWARDPVEGKQCCGLSWNPYIYTRDNPVKFTDPTGRLLFEEGGSVQKWTAIIVGLTILGEVIREGFECSAEKAKSAVPVVTGPPENCFIKPHDDWPPPPVPEPDPLRWPEPWER